MENTPIIEITNMMLEDADPSQRYATGQLVICPGDRLAIVTERAKDARRLLRTLATLSRPHQGVFRFHGKKVDVANYRKCLEVKQKIGYVASDSGMISNRTILENILLSRFYMENDLTIDLDATTYQLCEYAGIVPHLHQRPFVLSEVDSMKSIAIREMSKNPDVLLLDRPESFLRFGKEDEVFNHLKKMVRSGTAAVFFTHHQKLANWADHLLILADGRIQIRSVDGQDRTESNLAD